MLYTAACKEDVTILLLDDNAAKFLQADTSYQVSLAKGFGEPLKVMSEITKGSRFSSRYL